MFPAIASIPKRSVLGSLLLLSACGSVETPTIPPDPISLEISSPNAEGSVCGCKNSQAVYAKNSSGDTRQFSWMIHVRDTSSNVTLTPIPGGPQDVPPFQQAGQRTFIGCTIYAPTTNCRFQAKYDKRNSLRVRDNPHDLAQILGAKSTPSITTCALSCANVGGENTATCLPLTAAHFQAVAPLRDLIFAAQGGNRYVTIEEILKTYHLKPSDDKCERQGISVKDGLVVNLGKDFGDGHVCTLHSKYISAAARRTLGISKSFGGLDTVAYLPPRIQGEAAPTFKALYAENAILFQQSDFAPMLAFEGTGGKELSKNFGGPVLGTARISRPGFPSQTIVATSNGCLSVEEP